MLWLQIWWVIRLPTCQVPPNILQFGVSSGLGLFPITFDWAQIAYIGSPLLTPWWAAANVVGGLILVMWVMAPIMCKWTNYGEEMPINLIRL